MRPLRLSLLVALFLALAAGAAAQPDAVRVRLFGRTSPGAVTVSGPAALTVDGRPAGRISGTATVERRGAGVRVSGGGVEAAGQSVEVTPDALLHVVGGRAQVDVHGRLVASVVGSELVAVNHVPMPDYVASVVASEYGFPEIEGVKAQAVLARTYAVRASKPSQPYDLDDHQGSQVYRGEGVVTATTREAERATRGQVLTYGGMPVEALYSSSSGGHTADNESIWLTNPVPYLRGVPDPFDADAPDHAWRTTADAERVHAVLSRRFGGRVTGVSVAERSREGRAVRVRLDGARAALVSGSDFRSAVNSALGWRTVRSTNVAISRQGAQYVFDGRGFGHGVGMSQYGARGQARAGRSYLEILAFYFQGTEVSGAPRPALLASIPAPSPVFPAETPIETPPAYEAPRAPRGRGEAVTIRGAPPVAQAPPAQAPPAQAPRATAAQPPRVQSPPAAPAAGTRWPTPRRAARGGW